MELHDFYEGHKFGIPELVLNSAYWRFVLSNNAKIVLPVLWRSAIMDKKYFTNGVLWANIKDSTLLEKIGGMSLATLRRTIRELDDLGVIVKVDKKIRSSRYFLGFVDNKNNRYYLLFHLILKYEEIIAEYMSDRIDKFIENRKKPLVIDPSAYRLLSSYKVFIKDCFDDPRKLVTKKIDKYLTLTEVLFNQKNFFKPRAVLKEDNEVKHQFDV